MAYYIKDLCKYANLKFKEAIEEVQKVNPKFKVTGGPQTEIDFETFKATCQNHSIDVNEDGHILKYIDTDGGKTKFAPTTPVKAAVPKLTYNDITLGEYNKLKAEKIDPLKIKAELLQIPANVDIALEFIKTLNAEKTILNDSLIHDTPYLKALYQEYSYVIMPTQLGHRIRKQLEPFFNKNFITDKFNNKIIAFSRTKVLYSFILNI